MGGFIFLTHAHEHIRYFWIELLFLRLLTEGKKSNPTMQTFKGEQDAAETWLLLLAGCALS